MTKRKVIRESNRLFTYNPNYYNWGGDFKEALKGLGPFDLKNTFSGTNVANMLKGGLASGLGSTLGNIGGNLISGGLESSAGSAFSNIGGTMGKAISAVNPVLGGLMSAGSGIIGGGINAVLGSKLNQEKINEIEGSNEGMNTLIVDNSNTDTIENQWANQNFGVDFTQSDIGKDGLFSNKAKNKYKELKLQQDIARNRAFASYENAINSADFNQDLNLLQNYAAYGGLLDMNNQYSDGGKIYIKPENRGKFISLKERTGKSATWFKEHGTPAQKKMATFALNSRHWSHDYGGPLDSLIMDINKRSNADFVQRLLDPNRDYIQDWESDNIATHKLGYATDDKGAIVYPNVQRIDGKLYDFTDPKNKRGKWDALDSAIQRGDTIRMSPSQAREFTETYKNYYPKGKTFRANGGPLSTHGLDLSNGVIEINNGGTHEENPMKGIQMGIDNQGIPNLVEEGEVVFNDYVFSNRLNVPKAVKNKYKLRGNKELTFADAAKQMQKESEERPNDPISKKGLTSSISILQQAQEDVRQKKQQNKENRSNKFKEGGNLVPTDILNDPRWKTAPKLPNNFNSDPFVGLRPFLDAKTSESTMFTDELNKGIASYKKGLQSYFSRDNNNDDIATPWLRYAPAFGSALGVGYNLLSKPDYSRANALEQYVQNAGKVTPISYEPIGNYLTYRPTDLSYQANRMAAQAGATRRNIMNTSGGNRANAIGSLLAADYNNQIAMGEAIRKAEETNFARRAQVEEFNRGTNQYNSEAALKAAIANQEARLRASQLGLSGYTTAMQMKDAIDAQRAKTLSANLTNLFESLGQIGEEQYDNNRLKWLERKGVLRSDYFDTGKYNNGRG